MNEYLLRNGDIYIINKTLQKIKELTSIFLTTDILLTEILGLFVSASCTNVTLHGHHLCGLDIRYSQNPLQ